LTSKTPCYALSVRIRLVAEMSNEKELFRFFVTVLGSILMCMETTSPSRSRCTP
jgi:hypothetical protein